MYLQQALREYHQKQVKRFNNFIERIPKAEMEDIHQLRVSIKKIRAMGQLMTFINDDFNYKQHLHSIRPTYKSLGEIREKQKNLELLDETYDPNFLLLNFRSMHRKFIKKRTNLLVHIDIERHKADSAYYLKAYENSINQFPEEVILQAALDKVRANVDKIYKELKNNDSDLHRVRKLVKQLLFIQTAVGLARYKVFENKTLNTLQSLEVILGNWHDLVVLYEHLGPFSIKRSSIETKQLPERMYTDILDMQDCIFSYTDTLAFGQVDKMLQVNF